MFETFRASLSVLRVMRSQRDIRVTEGITCPVCKANPGEECYYTNRWKRRTILKHPHSRRVTAFEYRAMTRDEPRPRRRA